MEQKWYTLLLFIISIKREWNIRLETIHRLLDGELVIAVFNQLSYPGVPVIAIFNVEEEKYLLMKNLLICATMVGTQGKLKFKGLL